MQYWELFWSFFQIGLFSIGGGYASLPLTQQQIVEKHGWLTKTSFSDIITISQMTPGPIAINAATFVGIKVGGTLGAVVATLGSVLPSCIIVLILAYMYYRYRTLTVVKEVLGGLRPAVVALIASAGLSIVAMSFWNGQEVVWNTQSIDFIAVAIFTVAIFVLRKWKPNPIFVMAVAGILGGIVYSFV